MITRSLKESSRRRTVLQCVLLQGSSFFFFSSRRRHTRCYRDWSSDVCSSDLELFALGMASSMTVPMVAWMRRRGHGWRNSVEMSAAMVVPALALILCYRLDAVAAGSICPLACATMIPAMVVAMLYRLDDYTGHPSAARIAES